MVKITDGFSPLGPDFDPLTQYQKIKVTQQSFQQNEKDNFYVFSGKHRKTMKFSKFAEEAMAIDEKYKDLSVNEISDLIMKLQETNPKYAFDQDDNDIKMLPESDIFDFLKIKLMIIIIYVIILK